MYKTRDDQNVKKSAIMALEKILVRDSAALSPDELHQLAKVEDGWVLLPVYTDIGWDVDGRWSSFSIKIDASQVRDRARRELLRRGLEA